MQFDQNGWLDVATEIDVTANSFTRQGQPLKYIVLHGTAGGTSAADVANYMKSTVGGSNPVSTHFVIGTDGAIVQCVPVSLASWGNGELDAGHVTFIPAESINPNLYTISIEHCKPSSDNSDALTPEQETASFALVNCLCETYRIAKQPGNGDSGIMTHAQFAPINRARCPGTYPWGRLWAFLENGGNMGITINTPGVSNFFAASGSMWICKSNKCTLGNAMLAFYQKFGGDHLCGLTYLGLPTGNEQAVPQMSGCSYQRFERAVLVYDPSHAIDNPPGSGSVYLAHLSTGVGEDPRVIELQAELDANDQAKTITSLKAKINAAVTALQ